MPSPHDPSEPAGPETGTRRPLPDLAERVARTLRPDHAHASASPRAKVAIRETLPADAESFVALMTLADPHAGPEQLWEIRRMIQDGPRPLAQYGELALVAVNESKKVVGALFVLDSAWLLTRPDIAPAYRRPLELRVLTIQGLAVRPGYRRTGVGRALLRRAESAMRAAGCGLSAIFHEPHLSAYYAKMGYTSRRAFAAYLPDGTFLNLQYGESARIAVKPLDAGVRAVTVFGLSVPVIDGLLPGTGLPDGAWFDPRTRDLRS